MGLLKDRILLFRIPLAFIILILLVFLMAVPVDGHCTTPSPVINATPVENVAMGTNITVTGQNFTPNEIAVLYLPNQTYVSQIDKNGNVNWSIKKTLPGWYQIYALDENSTSRKSNAIMIYPLLNDATLTYTPTPSPTSVTSSPVISANPVVNVVVGMNITVSGQNFTPNGTAVLYSQGYGFPGKTYTAIVDKNGNTSWTFTNGMIAPYTIYALDENSTSRKSNSITIGARLNDATPTPAFPMDTTFIILITTCAVLLVVDRSKKK